MIVAYSLVCVAVGVLLSHAVLLGWLPAQPFDWLQERGKRTGAALWLVVVVVMQRCGRRAF